MLTQKDNQNKKYKKKTKPKHKKIPDKDDQNIKISKT